jgi:hypothetical protein
METTMSIILMMCMSTELLAHDHTVGQGARPARMKFFDGIQLERQADRRPPPEDVEGEVLEVYDGNLVLISLGSDAIGKGMDLEVYRIDPKPFYVGSVRVILVGKRFSLVRFSGPRMTIKVGDLVTTAKLIPEK